MTVIPHQEIYSNGSSVHYFCRSDKVLIGEPLRTCRNGKWDSRIPLCGEFVVISQLENFIISINTKTFSHSFISIVFIYFIRLRVKFS
jgi:hypothetical protein